MSDQPQYYRITDSLESLSIRIRLRKVRKYVVYASFDSKPPSFAMSTSLQLGRHAESPKNFLSAAADVASQRSFSRAPRCSLHHLPMHDKENDHICSFSVQ